MQILLLKQLLCIYFVFVADVLVSNMLSVMLDCSFNRYAVLFGGIFHIGALRCCAPGRALPMLLSGLLSNSNPLFPPIIRAGAVYVAESVIGIEGNALFAKNSARGDAGEKRRLWYIARSEVHV